MCNDLDGRCYRVAPKDIANARKSSDMIAKINLFCVEFLRRLRAKYLFNKQGTPEQRSIIKFLMDNYDPHTFIEHTPMDGTNNSYVKNKGDEFGVCIREKRSGRDNLHDFNTIQFVVIHELSHLSARGIGHGTEFYRNFKMLLKDAHSFGLYTPINYRKTPTDYCQIMLEDNPYFDDNIPGF